MKEIVNKEHLLLIGFEMERGVDGGVDREVDRGRIEEWAWLVGWLVG